jgi:hypothetical protein
MTKAINLEQAAAGEIAGALAVGRGSKRQRLKNGNGHLLTPAQARAVADLLRYLLFVAKESGADRQRVRFGRVSVRLRESRAEELLSVKTA